MNPAEFPEQNVVLNANNENGLRPLPVFRGLYDDGTRFFVSKWAPSQEDIERIVKGEPIWFLVCSEFHPPVLLTTGKPAPLISTGT